MEHKKFKHPTEPDRSLVREREMRRELSVILESISDAFFAVDGEWRFTYVNQKAEEFWARRRSELLGKNVWEEFPQVVGSEQHRAIRRALEEGVTTSFEAVSPVVGVWIAGRAYPSANGVSVFFQDVTARKEAAEALKESEERLRRVIEIETVGVIFFKADGSITDANEAFLRMSGYSREDLAGELLRWDDMTPPEWMPHSLKALEEFRKTGRTTPYEKEYIRKDGSRWWALFAARRLGAEEGVEFVIDITESKRAEAALRENEEWLRLAERAARSGTWEWDLVSGEIRWSPEHRALFGLDLEEPVTRERWWAAVHPDDLPSIEEAGRRCSEEGEEWPEIEYRISRDNEKRWIHARGRTVRDGRGHPVRIRGISVDITSSKKAEEEREQLIAHELTVRAQSEERRRLSRELHDRVAHDMALVHQSLELHEALKTSDPDRARAKLELAKATARGALDSTRNLSMELRRPEVRRGLEAALADLLRDLVPPTVGSGLLAKGDESPVPSELRNQLFVILREAIRNAVTHSGCHRITVRLEILPGEVVGSVEDDGRGFRAETVRPADHNGLRSMEERVALLGGTLDVCSAPGRGTTVKMTVPLGERDGG